LSFWACIVAALIVVVKVAVFEQRALHDRSIYIASLLVLSSAVILVRPLMTKFTAKRELLFEELPVPALVTIDLHPDGVPMRSLHGNRD